jgi:hypothetical protein
MVQYEKGVRDIDKFKEREPRVKLVVGVETSLSHVKTCQRNL